MKCFKNLFEEKASLYFEAMKNGNLKKWFVNSIRKAIQSLVHGSAEKNLGENNKKVYPKNPKK